MFYIRGMVCKVNESNQLPVHLPLQVLQNGLGDTMDVRAVQVGNPRGLGRILWIHRFNDQRIPNSGAIPWATLEINRLDSLDQF